MEIKITKNYDEMSSVAAKMVAKQIEAKKDSRICFATGGTPLKTYQDLIALYKENKVSFKDVVSFNLDEYVGVQETNKCSYHYYMHHNLFDHIDIQKQNINFPNGNGDLVANSLSYEEKIKALGGIDFMILGIGTNGHIAFNEPGSKVTDRTREVSLTKSTIESNKIYFDSEKDVPKTAVSMGIGTILEAKKIILIANGESKAQAIYDAIKKPVSEDCPASFLQLHKDVTFILDEAAAKLI
ncbi:glucosamine-6-phosphate deaminase [Mycoplasma corogypsi]|uniref:glucosamine-6-phosphate deaminase n=1 Tax=Mycoplasma corogypsi TaxID=2106 RepID=UPI003872C24E